MWDFCLCSVNSFTSGADYVDMFCCVSGDAGVELERRFSSIFLHNVSVSGKMMELLRQGTQDVFRVGSMPFVYIYVH